MKILFWFSYSLRIFHRTTLHTEAMILQLSKNGSQPELSAAAQLPVKKDTVVGANSCQNKDVSTPAQNQYINSPAVPTLVVPSVSNNGVGEAMQCPVLPSLATPKPSSPPPIVIQPCPGSPHIYDSWSPCQLSARNHNCDQRCATFPHQSRSTISYQHQ